MLGVLILTMGVASSCSISSLGTQVSLFEPVDHCCCEGPPGSGLVLLLLDTPVKGDCDG